MQTFVRINKFDVIQLENKGKYGWQLFLGYEDKAGEFKVKFAKREFGKGNEKVVPISIPLGDDPIHVLRTLLAQFTTEETPDTEDVPF